MEWRPAPFELPIAASQHVASRVRATATKESRARYDGRDAQHLFPA